MKKVKIIADSTCDLSKELLERYDISIIPLHIHMGEQEYLDGCTITPEDIYKWSDETKQTPKTSALSPMEAQNYINQALEEAEEVICFCISEKLSSTCSVLYMAAMDLEVNDKVFVVDSKNLSTGIGLQIIEAAMMAEEGKGAKEIVEKIVSLQNKVHASFVVDTLTYLYRGGRCNGVAALAGNSLKLHPCIVVVDGAMEVGKFYRGNINRAFMHYVEDMDKGLQNAKKDYIFITHSGCDIETIEQIQSHLYELGFQEVLVTRAGSVITSHCGPGTLGVLYLEA